jgi:hypothetical protein
MHFPIVSKAAFIASLLVTAQCSPTLLRRINDCGDSTFVNQVSGASPTVADCNHLASNIAGDGTWTVSDTGQHQLAQYGTCALGVQATSNGWYAYIGNEDIRDLIYESIRRFQWNGLVGSKGHMECQSGKGTLGDIGIDWGIYHT